MNSSECKTIDKVDTKTLYKGVHKCTNGENDTEIYVKMTNDKEGFWILKTPLKSVKTKMKWISSKCPTK